MRKISSQKSLFRGPKISGAMLLCSPISAMGYENDGYSELISQGLSPRGVRVVKKLSDPLFQLSDPCLSEKPKKKFKPANAKKKKNEMLPIFERKFCC